MTRGGAMTRRQAKFRLPAALQEPHRSFASVIRKDRHASPICRAKCVTRSSRISRALARYQVRNRPSALEDRSLPRRNSPFSFRRYSPPATIAQPVLLAQEGKRLPLQEPPRRSFFLQHPGLGELPGDPVAVLVHKGQYLAAGKLQRRTNEDSPLFRDFDGDRFPS